MPVLICLLSFAIGVGAQLTSDPLWLVVGFTSSIAIGLSYTNIQNRRQDLRTLVTVIAYEASDEPARKVIMDSLRKLIP